MSIAHDVLGALAGKRLPSHDEKALQAAIADVLTEHDIVHLREVKVTGGVIDFLAGGKHIGFGSGCVGIEVKIAGGARAILRQLARYAADSRITELVLVTGKAVALPTEIAGKPIVVFSIGRAWL